MIREATLADLPRIHAIRMGVHENILRDPARVTAEEVDWYREHAIFLVSESAGEVAGSPAPTIRPGWSGRCSSIRTRRDAATAGPCSTKRWRG